MGKTLHNSPKKNPLAKKAGGGVLSAAEKRRRMLEAGKRFVMKSVRHLSPARLTGRATFHGAGASKITFARENSSLSQLANSHLKGSIKKCSPQAIPASRTPAIKERCDFPSGDDEVFRKDENSISEILNHRSISRSTGRSSLITRQNRPSLFPNGINPVDQALLRLSARKPVPPKKPPRTFEEGGLQPEASAPDMKSSSITPSGKTPGKSVRFADDVMQKSPSSPQQLHDSLVKEWSHLLDSVSDLQLKEILKALPKESLQRISSVVIQIESEARGRGAKRALFFMNKCSTISEDEDSDEARMNEESPSTMQVKTCTPLRPYNTRRKSDIKANEEVREFVDKKPVEDQENHDENRPKNPLSSILSETPKEGTPKNLFRPIVVLNTPKLIFARVPYNLRSSPVDAVSSAAVSKQQ